MSRRVMERELRKLALVRECRVCGCTDERACVGADGRPCHWVAADLCSACVDLAAAASIEGVEVPAGHVERASGLVVPSQYGEA